MNELERVLAYVHEDRRGFFRKVLVGAGAVAVALPLLTTESLAQKAGEDPGPDGKCDEGLVVGKKSGKCQVPKKKAPAPSP